MRAEAGPSGPLHDEISRRAFELYCERGRTDGQDLEDWLQAEREILGSSRVAVA
jgi:hypothetical protein